MTVHSGSHAWPRAALMRKEIASDAPTIIHLSGAIWTTFCHKLVQQSIKLKSLYDYTQCIPNILGTLHIWGPYAIARPTRAQIRAWARPNQTYLPSLTSATNDAASFRNGEPVQRASGGFSNGKHSLHCSPLTSYHPLTSYIPPLTSYPPLREYNNRTLSQPTEDQELLHLICTEIL